MNKKFLPAIGIITAAIILILINELTEFTFIKNYALIFIIGGMYLSIWLTKLSDKFWK